MQWNLTNSKSLFSGSDAKKLMRKGKWGLEKESLRTDKDGDLSMTPHPSAFGDKLDNPFVTTDFSESQIELITPPLPSVEESLKYLEKLQGDAEQVIGRELLWPLSMPASLPDEDEIPVASYGNSPAGREKEVYRRGLAVRYGKKMQMISGIHFNFSFHRDFWKILHDEYDPLADFRQFTDEAYFSLARNFLRYRWLLIYLFGASPTADHKYLQDMGSDFDSLQCLCRSERSRELSGNITSIRMSRLGYQNKQQENFSVSYNSLAEYISDLQILMNTESGHYKSMGLYRNNEQIQLNSRLLQLENEYYSPIRFKQIARSGETQINALEKRGIEYLEIRAFDLNPFDRAGIGLEQLYFTQMFMIFCLFKESPLLTAEETAVIDENSQRAALFGRAAGLELSGTDKSTGHLDAMARSILTELEGIAAMMDEKSGKNYIETIARQMQKTEDHSLLPSQMIISEMISRDESYLQFGLRKSLEHIQSESGLCPMGIEIANPESCIFKKNGSCSGCSSYLQE